MVSAPMMSGGVTLSYLLLYTAFSKATKKLDPGLLLDVLLVRKGLDHTLVEWNKAISLAGLTLLTIAFCPGFYLQRWELLLHAMLMLWVHSAYSTWKYYGSPNIPHLSSWPNVVSEFTSTNAKERAAAMKKLSVVLGSLGQMALFLGYLGYVLPSTLCYGAVALGVLHFYTMEINYKWVLGVRPYAYLPFPLAAIALVWFTVVG